jgi:hypothetical protein
VEDLSIFKVTKDTKKGKEREYWHAPWKHGDKSHSLYLGGCGKMTAEEARLKAQAMK